MMHVRSLPVPAWIVADEEDTTRALRRTVIGGLALLAALLFGLIGWTFFAVLDSAVIAPGFMVVDSQRKTVQHLEGGILRELNVRDGDRVKAGQILAVLDRTQSEAQLGQLRNQILAVQARIARLRAEQEGVRRMVVPAEIRSLSADPVVAEIINVQEQLFQARWRAYDSSVAVLNKRIEQFKEEVAGNESLHVATTRRLALSEEELNGVAGLVERGFERRTRLLELQRTAAELRGKQGEYRGAAARNRQAIAGAQIEIANLGDSRASEVAKELQEVTALEADLTDRIRAATDIRDRREIVAPQNGIVVNLRLVTPGGVIGPGQPLLDIVPVQDELLVEARVHPADIDVVHVGLKTRVRISAYKTLLAPTVDSELVYVAADMMRDERTNEPYFTARARLLPESLKEWPSLKLYPGMPTEVMIVTGERRAIDYLLAPIADRLRRSFREE